MTVVSGDEDKSLVTDAKLLELFDGGADGIVHLEKLAQGTVVVESVHLLINGSTLGHEEEALLLAAGGENLDGLDGHLLEAGNVGGGAVLASGVVLEILDVVLVHVTVEPDGKGALAKDTESALAVVSSLESSVVEANRVALLGKLLVVVLALVGALAGVELLGTAAKEDIRTIVGSPGKVGDTVESLVNESTVLGTLAGVASEGNGSSIGKEGGRNGTPSTTLSMSALSVMENCGMTLTQTRWKISTIVSTLGSSKASGEESAWTLGLLAMCLLMHGKQTYPMALTVLL